MKRMETKILQYKSKSDKWNFILTCLFIKARRTFSDVNLALISREMTTFRYHVIHVDQSRDYVRSRGVLLLFNSYLLLFFCTLGVVNE